jgi:hypothetical protein
MVNNCSMTVNYHGILTLEIIGFFTADYRGIFITLAPGARGSSPHIYSVTTSLGSQGKQGMSLLHRIADILVKCK